MTRISSLAVCSVCALLTLGLPALARGQERAEFELALVNGLPLGGLGSGIDGTAWGGSFYGARFVRGTAVSVGGRLAFATYGSDRSDELRGWSTAAGAGATYRYDVLTAHVVVRVQPRMARLTPYAEAQAGVHCFLTQAYSGGSSAVPVLVGDAVMLIGGDGSKTLLSSVAPSVGVGGGLKLRLVRFGGGRAGGRSPMTLLLDLQGRYLLGGTARYLAPGGLSHQGDRLVLDSRRSSTNLLFLSLGLSLRRTFTRPKES